MSNLPVNRQEQYKIAKSCFDQAFLEYGLFCKYMPEDTPLARECMPEYFIEHPLAWTDKYLDCPYLFNTIFKSFNLSKEKDFKTFFANYKEKDFIRDAQQRNISTLNETKFVSTQRDAFQAFRKPKASKSSPKTEAAPALTMGELDVKNEGVYERSLSLFEGLTVPVVVYAPPHSGKTTLLETVDQSKVDTLDTDDLPTWDHLPEVVVTNMPHLISRGKISYAVVPTRTTFIDRCIKRGLAPVPKWYNDMLKYSYLSTHRILSDAYLMDIPQIIEVFESPG